MRYLLIPLILGGIGFIGYQMVRHRREMDTALMVKLVVSVLLLILMLWGTTLSTGATAAMGLPFVVLGLIWAPTIAGMMSDGTLGFLTGSENLGSKPNYAMAEGKRGRGDLTGALAEIEGQLQQFPDDFDGQLLIAQIHAENLRDLATARATLENLVTQPHHTPAQISRALNTLADWQIRFAQDRPAAQATLQMLIARYPGTALALKIAQRAARMADTFEADQPGDVGTLVSQCMKHLEVHPLDNHTREVLAEIYFRRYERADLAIAQLDLLVQTPHQSREDVARWLHLMADWHLKMGNLLSARAALEEIETRLPGHVLAEKARERLFLLKNRQSA